jgi:hypothetical protein
MAGLFARRAPAVLRAGYSTASGDVGAEARITWIEGYVKNRSLRPVRAVCNTAALQLDTRCNTKDDVLNCRTQMHSTVHRNMDVRWCRAGGVSEFGYCLDGEEQDRALHLLACSANTVGRVHAARLILTEARALCA